VISAISGGQFRRKGGKTSPRPRVMNSVRPFTSSSPAIRRRPRRVGT